MHPVNRKTTNKNNHFTPIGGNLIPPVGVSVLALPHIIQTEGERFRMKGLKGLALILALALVGLSLLSRLVGSRQVAEPVAVNKSSEEARNDHTKITDGEPIDFAVKQEIRKEFILKPGATVYVFGVNGKLDVTTSDTDKAEVYLVRSVRKAEDFDERQPRIEMDDDSLEIVIRKNRRISLWAELGSSNEERQRLELKLPRNVVFHANRNTGNLTIGELDNALLVDGLKGNLKAARAVYRGVFEEINGNVDATLGNLTSGLAIQGINGNLDFHFTETVNADVGIRRHNGQFNSELPNTTIKEQKHSRVEARIGNGGVSIEVNGINGSINLLSAAKVASK